MKQRRIALVGNPNCGKTTLFNRLTGAQQRVGNWPGVTVECKTGRFSAEQCEVDVVDLPGIYTLTAVSQDACLDERIACDYLLSKHPDLMINVVDAGHLERHLFLTTQLLERGIPVILVLNMMDVARKAQLAIDTVKLSQRLGCPVIPVVASTGEGLAALKQAIVTVDVSTLQTQSVVEYPAALTMALDTVSATIQEAHPEHQQQARSLALQCFDGDAVIRASLAPIVQSCLQAQETELATSLQEDSDIMIANARYVFLHQLMTEVARKSSAPHRVTQAIDQVVLNRFLGVPIFLLVMYSLFFFAINVGGAFQDFFDIGSDVLFVKGVAYQLHQWHAPSWLVIMLAEGVGRGINTVLTFIPVIGAMFLFLALLEDSGYMARAAFVMDRFMRGLGLPGKSFVPLIVGFGCNVPSIMAARTLNNWRDRVLTIMMSPFMSCGARLAIYAVFIAVFFPHGGQNIIFALYLIGVLMAVVTGLLLRKTLLPGEASPLIMELPPYHLPLVSSLFLHAWSRLKKFLLKAGRFIIPISLLIGSLNHWSIETYDVQQHTVVKQSVLAMVGREMTPLFAPMGIRQDNWPATVGLFTGILAKEVVVGTLNTLYSPPSTLETSKTFHLMAGLNAAVQSVSYNVRHLVDTLANPIAGSIPEHGMSKGALGEMYQRFDGRIGAFAYLLFILLYFPCVSTTAVMWRELNRSWTLFSVGWTTVLAYGTAVAFYQAATWLRHPEASSFWLSAVGLSFVGGIAWVRWSANGSKPQPC